MSFSAEMDTDVNVGMNKSVPSQDPHSQQSLTDSTWPIKH